MPLPVPVLPESWLAAPGWSVVPVAGEVVDAWAAVVPDAAHLARRLAGVPAHARPRRAGHASPAVVVGIVARADLVGVSHHDVAPETPLAALSDLLHPGADLLVTHGDLGGLLVHDGSDGRTETLRYLPTATDGESDPTGAGDTFLAALQASVLRPAIVGRRRSRPGSTCASRPRQVHSSSRVPGSMACPTAPRCSSVVRASGSGARSCPSEVTQVGVVGPP